MNLKLKETERILLYTNGQLPESGYIKFALQIEMPLVSYRLIEEVILIISRCSSEDWPDEQAWRELLPFWFLSKFQDSSAPEHMAETNWDFGSWLDAMEFRGWEWYSSKLLLHGFEIILEPFDLPFSIGPLEYIFLQAGVNREKILYTEHW